MNIYSPTYPVAQDLQMVFQIVFKFPVHPRPLLPKRHKQLNRQTRAAAPSTPRLFNMGTVANESFKAKVP